MIKALEKIPKIEICGECGRKYNLKTRLVKTRNTPKPNTAEKYCNNNCWIQGIAAQEYA